MTTTRGDGQTPLTRLTTNSVGTHGTVVARVRKQLSVRRAPCAVRRAPCAVRRTARAPRLAVMDTPDAVRPPLRAADHPLATAKYVQLTTFRRTGEGVPTPVWFAPSVDDPTLFAVISVDNTGKTKRLAHTKRVELRACDMRGRVAEGTPTYAGTARVVRNSAGIGHARRSVVAKYGFPARLSDLVDRAGTLVGLRRAARAGILVAVDPAPISRG